MSERELDVVVVGAGPAGEVAAGELGRAGLAVALVERELVGGECSYWACMPSKALLRPGEILREAGRVPGVRVEGLDAEAVLRRRDEVVHGLDDTPMLPWLEERGVELVRGEARLDGPAGPHKTGSSTNRGSTPADADASRSAGLSPSRRSRRNHMTVVSVRGIGSTVPAVRSDT